MDIDPKTIVTVPLFTLVLYLFLSFIVNLPLWTICIPLFISFIYIIMIIVVELYKK
ncbi:hypothetical protein SAMN04488113_10536 [Alkalibacterium gilvum]|uniref:Uncharacterized protein n=1 Tax=Alkalibacterium gilvum TaxID=1130080 RepID=A0A1H6S748_9LACT|nr:hypothetical protein SAMN04488113_10536 [Alkalibacterium gilvum]